MRSPTPTCSSTATSREKLSAHSTEQSTLPVSGLLNCAAKSHNRVRRERRWSTAGVYPPGNWFAPPGSNQSSSGGNETAEASGAEGRNGDLASVQAVT